jgi:hypothetical protein
MAKIRSTLKLISISTGNSDATKKGIGAMPVLLPRELEADFYKHRKFRCYKKRASVQCPYYCPESMFLTPESSFSTGSSDATTGYSDGTIFQLQNSSERLNG